MSERPSRGLWAVYWIACITCLVQFAPTSASTAIPNIVARKFFHFVAVAMFAPVVLVDVSFMALCLLSLNFRYAFARVLF